MQSIISDNVLSRIEIKNSKFSGYVIVKYAYE